MDIAIVIRMMVPKKFIPLSIKGLLFMTWNMNLDSSHVHKNEKPSFSGRLQKCYYCLMSLSLFHSTMSSFLLLDKSFYRIILDCWQRGRNKKADKSLRRSQPQNLVLFACIDDYSYYTMNVLIRSILCCVDVAIPDD